jgi:NTE family protein
MSVEIAGEERRIGLALSGGGFRAAAFHLGVFQKLRELNLLSQIDVLSCVSGGSIAGAFLALNWKSATVLQDLERYLATKSIAVGSVIGGVLDPFESRLDKLAKSYDRDLFNDRGLSALRDGPRIYLNATNLATGNLFFFVAGGNGALAEEMGEHELGVVGAEHFKISRAVAASSAFPPVFPPLRLDADEYPPGDPVGYVTLTDGGVYDNMGVGPLLRERNDVHYLIVSDGGKPFSLVNEPTTAGAVVLKEGIGIMMEQIRGLEFDRMEYRARAGAGPRPVWFSIDSTAGELQHGDADFASAIDTNLKALKPSELSVLKRHGGALLEHRLRKYLPELLV